MRWSNVPLPWLLYLYCTSSACIHVCTARALHRALGAKLRCGSCRKECVAWNGLAWGLNGISYIHTLCAICLLRCMCRARSSAVLVAYVICAKLRWSLPYSHFLEACRDSKRNETKRPLGLTSPLSLLDCQATLFGSTALVCFWGGGERRLR